MKTTSFSIIFMVIIELLFIAEVAKTIFNRHQDISKHSLQIQDINRKYKAADSVYPSSKLIFPHQLAHK